MKIKTTKSAAPAAKRSNIYLVLTILPLLACIGWHLPACGQPAPSPKDASLPSTNFAASSNVPALNSEEVVSQLVRRNLERSRALETYEGTRVYRLDYKGFGGARSAEMVVDVKYHSPGAKEFTIRSASGSKIIIERVFKKLLQSETEALDAENQKSTALNNENYRFTLLGSETSAGRSLYVLAVEPLTRSKFLYRGKIWVDAQDFAVARIEGEPAKNPSFWTKDTRIEQVYCKVNDFWLPASNRSASTIRLGGRANFSIDYKDYRMVHPSSAAKIVNIIASSH